MRKQVAMKTVITQQSNLNVNGDIVNGIKKGLDEKQVKSFLEEQVRLIIDKMKKSGEKITEDVEEKVRALVERKFDEFICDIRADQAKREDDIKKTVQEKFKALQQNEGLLFKNVEVKLDELDHLLQETTYNLETICGRLIDVAEQFNEWLKECIKTSAIELEQGKENLKSANFARANAYFDKATQNNDMKAAAYFGKALAEWRIQLIWDSEKNAVQPILYNYDIDLSEGNGSHYQMALRFATEEQKTAFRSFVQKIENIRNNLRWFRDDDRARGISSYDCFICMKVRDEGGNYTPDYNWLIEQGVYEKLSQCPEVRPFFSEVDCHKRSVEKGTAEYESLIYYALSTANVMLLVCSDEKYLSTPWVKNEINRFQNFWDRKGEDPFSRIIVVFHSTVIELPGAAEKFQGYDRAYRSVDDIVEAVKNAVMGAKKFIDGNYKYCPQCGRQYALDERWCSRCKDRPELVEGITWVNLTRAQEEEDHKRKDEKAKQENEALKRKDKEHEREIEELKRRLLLLGWTTGGITKDDFKDEVEKLNEQDAAKARFEKLSAHPAGKRDASTWYTLGLCYLFGDGVEQDREEAKKCLLHAEECYSQETKYKIGLLYDDVPYYRFGSSVVSDDDIQMKEEDVQARKEIRDYSKAVALYRESAECGIPLAKCLLGRCFMEGKGVQKDSGRAMELFKEVATCGYPMAFWFIGECYKNGCGVQQNDEEATKNYKIAARCGNTWAQYDLGYMYETGRGVKRNSRKAVKWYRKAALRGNEDARKALKERFAQTVSSRFSNPYVGRDMAVFQHKWMWWMWTLILCSCLLGVISLYWTKCHELYFGNAWSWIYVILFAIATLIGFMRLIVEYKCVNITSDNVKMADPGVLFDCAKGLFVLVPFIVGILCEILHPLIISFVAFVLGIVLDVKCTWKRDHIFYAIIDIFVLCLYGLCLGSCCFSFVEYSRYGDRIRDGDYVYIVNEDDTLSFLMEDYGEESLIIPSRCQGKVVTKIENLAHEEYYDLKNVVIPDSVTSIGERAFEGCTGLTAVTIGSGVITIGNYAFYKCTRLTGELMIPDSVTSIGAGAFYDCDGLTAVTIGSGVITIGNYAFYKCTGLTGELTIPDSVSSIGRWVFEGCTGLTSVTIMGGSIGTSAFWNCTGLTSVTIGSGVTSIGIDAFNGCSGLTRVDITDLTAWCKIDFEGSGANSLYYAHHLYLDGEEVTTLTIPEEITEIKAYAFAHCDGLTSVTIPDSVTSIGESAFYGCDGLTSVTIGKSVTSIGQWAFGAGGYYSTLTDIQFKGTVEEWQTIEKSSYWDSGTGNYIVTCTDGKISKSGTITYF